MAPSTDVWRLAIAELAIYVVLLPIVIYILVRHGKHGIDGWGFLTVFCVLRLTSSGLQVGDQNGTSATGSILNSIGISGLLMAFSGVTHELAKYNALHDGKLARNLAVLVHIMVVTGVVLAAVGGSKLSKPEDEDNDYTKDRNLQKGGYVVLVLVVLLLVAYNCTLLFRLQEQRTQHKKSSVKLLCFNLAALVFGIVRVAYGLASAVTASPELSPVTGTFVVKFVLIFLVQLIAAVLLIIGGLSSRNLPHEIQHAEKVPVRLEQ